MIEYKNDVTPIEVKEGSTGRLKSLHLFLDEKKKHQGIKISSANFTRDEKLLSTPLYAVEKLFAVG